MWLVSLRDLQWRRRRFLIAVVATALVFAMSLLMAGADAGLTSETRRIVDVVGGHAARVVGTADGVTYYFGGPTLFMPITDAQNLAFRGLPLAMTIVTKGVPQTVPPSLQAMTLAQVRTDLDRPSKNGKATIQFLNILLWLVAAGIIASIVYLSILERQRDFAVFKATGASSAALYGGLALQAVLLSVTAALVAAGLAHLLQPGFPFALDLTAVAVLRLLVVALAVGLLASLVGLRRAVAVDPALAFGGG